MKANHLRSLAKVLLCSLLLTALLLNFPLPARAASKYMHCTAADFTVVLDETGGAEITERWECYFGGDTISRYRRNYKNPGPWLAELDVYEVLMDGVPMTLLDAPDDSRPEGCAAVFQEDDGSTNVEMYFRALEQTHTFEINYYISDAVILYNDVAEFHTDLTSSHEAFDIDAITATVEIPHGAADHGLGFWAHGTTEGASFDARYDENEQPYSFFLQTGSTPKDKTVQVRFAMPLELFPEGRRFEDEDALQRILDEEHARQDLPVEPPQEEKSVFTTILDTIRNIYLGITGFFRFLLRALSLILPFAPFVLLLLLETLLNGIVIRLTVRPTVEKSRLRPYQASQYYRSLPDSMKPAMVHHLMTVYYELGDGRQVKKDGSTFSATILDLVEAGLITTGRNAEDEVTYQVSPDLREQVETEYEKIIAELFITAGAAEQSLTTKELTDYMRANYTWCKELYRSFDSAVDQAFEEAQLTVSHTQKDLDPNVLKISVIVYGLIIFLGLKLTMWAIPAAVVALGCSAVAYVLLPKLWKVFYPDYLTLTQEGENRLAMWKAYLNFLNDFTTFKDCNFSDLRVWRRHLVYATAMGCSTRVLENLRVVMPQTADALMSDPYFHDMNDICSSVSDIHREAGYVIHESSSSGGSDWGGGDSSDDWGGCSSSSSDSDSGSGGSDFD